MTFSSFQSDPWKKSYDAYDKAFFSMRPAPEYANSEVLVASLYRASGFRAHTERAVPAAGREFEKASRSRAKAMQRKGGVSVDTWQVVLHGVLESPKLPSQSSRRFLQLCPLVPETALYSGSARATGNPWNPGLLIERMIRIGAPDFETAKQTWKRLFDALTVSDRDDIWARWLQQEFDARATTKEKWGHSPLAPETDLPPSDKVDFDYPAKQFVRDLNAVVAAKDLMTRRQWISLLEAVLRLGSVMHVLWICNVNDQLWEIAREVLAGGKLPDDAGLRARLMSPTSSYVVYGKPLLPILRDYASRYLAARLGLNALLWRLAEEGVEVRNLNSFGQIRQFLEQLAGNAVQLGVSKTLEQITALKDDHARALACKKGIGKNLEEFGRHSLGQRQTANEVLRGYDQSYFLRKGGQHSGAPWVVSLGPVAVLALVHCCLNEVDGPRSVQRLTAHLSRYGIGLHHGDVANSDLGTKLRMLGLILDSPDAESGMLLTPPFEKLPFQSETKAS